MTDLEEALTGAREALERFREVDAANPPFVEDWADLSHTLNRALEELTEAVTPTKRVPPVLGTDSLWGDRILAVSDDSMDSEERLLKYVGRWPGRRAYFRTTEGEWEALN
jgi:hypothetical protein